MSNVYQKRIEAVRQGFDAAGIDALLLTGIYNISYITGTKGDDLNVLITRDDAYVITDFRYREMAQGLTWLTYFETSAKR
ncbi:MAG: aminopeptidase P family N-terminal domain-containing protein, partial [Firmicutes bacterium]|nr:aminopeptidase P family N-terminal domain-containing protein [Bacillota bacterium]